MSGNLKSKPELIAELNNDLDKLNSKINSLTLKRNFFENPILNSTSIASYYRKAEVKAWEDFLCVEQLISDLEGPPSVAISCKEFN